MRLIRLVSYATPYYVSFVDDEDYDIISKHKWNLTWASRRRTPYAYNTAVGYMHRLILKPPQGLEIHHIDNNGLNNTKTNLKVVEHVTNMRFAGPMRDKKYKGVYRANSRRLRFVAQIEGQHIGTWTTAEAAARAYDAEARKRWGEDCYVNFK